MGQLEGTRLRRRAVLLGASLALPGAAGCLEIDTGGENTVDNSGNGDGNGDDDVDGGGDTLAEPTAPEPGFIVGDSADADYETLQNAYDSLESGDVIGLEPGEHTVQLDVDNADVGDGEDLVKTYTYVGLADDPDETSIEFVQPEATSYIVRGPQRFRPEDGAPGFWHLTVDIPETVSFARIGAYEDDSDKLDDYLDEIFEDEDDREDHLAAHFEASEEDDLTEIYPNEQSTVNYCVVDGSFDGPVSAYETTFTDEVFYEVSPTNCRFYDDVGGPRVTANHCQFDGRVDGDGGWVYNSTIEGIASLNNLTMVRCELHSGLNVTGGGNVDDCEIQSKPDTDRAIDILSRYDVAIEHSEIYGTIRSNEDGSYIDRLEMNVVDAPSSARFVIDGAPATNIYLNVFRGGDVRITTDTGDLSSFPSDDIDLYDSERELGNYYAEWAGVDAADEGLLETRTLPGEDGEMDRFPLATDDIEAYAAEAEAEDEADDD
ncbi:hypothetical protein D8Y22_05170 [Salinadaptatus halalkaliphilus]|uniref:Right-handed parallel beta-helix repeat-containing protein n=1 Tax=Salinadaptatus halalkaliphilus TaxID=2419781 RepID=A0A4S3TRG5_9EURY|nr:hypothetical protein [Salinadaptatus halalkaliphilus]THE65915.1 hypothetical protein D8Y22_05170 [Salinadaptatus halalkaliphilus]